MTKRKVVNQILSARTLVEVRAARLARAKFLHEHPDDWEIIDYGSMLSRLEEALEMIESEQLARTA